MNKAKILLVDDTPLNLEILGKLLTPEYRVAVTTNGLEALELASSDDPPDMILLDILMPGLDGYQVCKILKENEKTRHIPIIFVTADTEIQSEEKGLGMGAVDYITKPYTPSIVLARVKTHLTLYNQRRLLEQLVLERTSELKKALGEAEVANRTKSAILANMSHELRTPLHGIIGMTELLMETSPSEKQKGFLKDARTASSRLLSMINGLLNLSSAETGDIQLSPCDFTLRSALAPALSHYYQRAVDKGLDFYSSFGKDIPGTLHADIGCIRQVVMSLLDNALKFTDQGSITFSVSITGNDGRQSTPVGNVNLIFTVTNTGLGIPAELHERIFEPFIIGEDFLTKRHSGAGLGLALSKRLVTLMGGHLWLESGEAHNIIFSFTIPCQLYGEASAD